jgi:glyoxylase-like metal-dependent hydrolase (beta-lactamase superfamily II)
VTSVYRENNHAAGFFWYSGRKGIMKTTYLTEVTEVKDGQVLDLPGAPRIISMPGHSPGSIAVYSSGAEAVSSGTHSPPAAC